MFGMDDARVADPIITSKPGQGQVSPKKKAKAHPHMPPVFSGQEKEFNIQVPDGWRTH